MKKQLGRIAGVIITCLLIGLIIGKLNHLVRPVSTDISVKAIDAFHALPENSLDVIAYGSSHTWRGFDPVVMEEKYGVRAYNYGNNWQKLNTTLLFLQDSMRTQKPKTAIVDTYCVDQVKQDMNMDGEIYYTRAISDFPGRRAYLRQCFGTDPQRYLSYYMPLTAFHDNWNDLDERHFQENASGTDFETSKGFRRSKDAKPAVLSDPAGFFQEELNETSLAVLDEMVRVCRDNGTKLLFITIPYEGEFHYHNAMEEYAEENGCDYVDLFYYIEEMGLSGETDFSDLDHLNSFGGAKVADFLGRYLRLS